MDAKVEYRTDASMAESYPGLVTARRESELGFERGGRIDSIAVDVGDRVTVGQVLARLDTRALEAQIVAANAQTAEAQAQVSGALPRAITSPRSPPWPVSRL